jgi:hypothetical protein
MIVKYLCGLYGLQNARNPAPPVTAGYKVSDFQAPLLGPGGTLKARLHLLLEAREQGRHADHEGR